MVDSDKALVCDEEAVERERLRSYTTIGTTLLAAVILVVTLVMWQSCSVDAGTRVAAYLALG